MFQKNDSFNFDNEYFPNKNIFFLEIGNQRKPLYGISDINIFFFLKNHEYIQKKLHMCYFISKDV